MGGKVLRVDDLGKPLADNPTPGSPVFASGFDTVTGLCVDASTSTIYASESAGGRDHLYAVAAGRSVNAARSLALPRATGISGCTVVSGNMVVSSLAGKDIFRAQVTSPTVFGPYTAVLASKYGRIGDVVGAEDGSIWLTTSNRDGQGAPVADDERVIHLQGGGGGGTPAPV